ncbi:MAG: hypothetical protein ACOYOK_07535 [Pseudobdellovibrionaceae bacterium]
MNLVGKKSINLNTSEFANFAESLSNRCLSLGYPILPFDRPTLPKFSSLPILEQEKALFNLKDFYAAISSVEPEDSIKSSRSLWVLLKNRRYKYHSSILENITDEHKIEIYNLDGILSWCSLNVFGICSYTVEEMKCYSWEERYSRNSDDTQKILNAIQEALKSKDLSPCVAKVNDHLVVERFSKKLYQLQVSHDLFAPLKDASGQINSFLVTSKVKILNS